MIWIFGGHTLLRHRSSRASSLKRSSTSLWGVLFLPFSARNKQSHRVSLIFWEEKNSGRDGESGRGLIQLELGDYLLTFYWNKDGALVVYHLVKRNLAYLGNSYGDSHWTRILWWVIICWVEVLTEVVGSWFLYEAKSFHCGEGGLAL